MSIKKVGQDGEYLHFFLKKKFLFVPFFINQPDTGFCQLFTHKIKKKHASPYKNNALLTRKLISK